MEQAHEKHIFDPVFDSQSRILILGTFPSVKSRENKFYYGHPQNRFWKVISAIFECPLPATIEEKKAMLITHHVAIWDVIDSCDITGTSDSSIKNVVSTDLSVILDNSNINKIYANGKTAEKLYGRYQESMIGKKIIGLPSTSPANAGYSLERLIEEWKCIKSELNIY